MLVKLNQKGRGVCVGVLPDFKAIELSGESVLSVPFERRPKKTEQS